VECGLEAARGLELSRKVRDEEDEDEDEDGKQRHRRTFEKRIG
jgi:hypothetical protein